MEFEEFEEKRKNLVEKLKKRNILTKTNVIKAMLKVPRHKFLAEGALSSAYIDSPLSIGMSQTISAPHMNAMMCELLKLKEGDKVLEIGTGSGYHAALCAEIIAPKNSQNPGHVYTIERHLELAERAKIRLIDTGYGDSVTVIHGDGTLGHPQEAPYDKILVTASSPKKVPPPLKEQLKDGGILVAPIEKGNKQVITRYTKNSESLHVEELDDCLFVPVKDGKGY